MNQVVEPEKMRLHFVGIGGIGMSGIAEVFHNQGYRVSGSDLHEGESTRRLQSLGIEISIGHRAENLKEACVVVISSAVRPENIEVVEARRRHIPVIPRAEMLGELMRGKTGIAVAGSHGKTTTTSLLAAILTEAGIDPTIVIGGRVDSLGGNAKLGQGSCVVAEADESDGSFLQLPALFGVITDIDNDHLDHYGSVDAIDDAFIDFVGNLPFYGCAAVCGEDIGVRRCLSKWTKPVVTYGFERTADEQWDYFIREVDLEPFGSRFEICSSSVESGQTRQLGSIQLRIPGKHNILNATGAAVIALRLGISFDVIASALEKFQGVKRRFEVCWRDGDRRAIVDDYGHHPTEIRYTLETARKFWKGRIIVVFQPHRYSRTLHCMDGFLSSFSEADLVYLTDIYAAGEPPIEGVSSSALVEKLQTVAREGQVFKHLSTPEDACSEIQNIFQEGDLLLCLGAGSITQLPRMVTQKLGLA